MNNEAKKCNIIPFRRPDKRVRSGNSIYQNNLKTQNHFTNAYAFLEMELHEKSIDSFDEYLQVNHRDSEAYDHKGYAMAKLEKYQEAIECYDKAIEIDPQLNHFY